MQLIALTLSFKLSLMLRKKLEIPISKEYIWKDSMVVLGYINNSNKNEKLFVANRIQFIRENANPMQWFYVPTRGNLADDSFRVLKNVHSEKAKSLFEGPGFLWTSESK